MSEVCEPAFISPSNGKWDSVLKSLYVDLFSLIVESRIPGINERGYGDGSHCPPIVGPNKHLCDLSRPECQKHQRLIYHLLRAVRHNVFEIEVLMLPDCCTETKLSDRIQNKEYILLERWSLKCLYGKTQPSIEVSELLRAIRSFLHFSQISAWLSLTKGKSPSNIYYWVKPTIDPSSTSFESYPEVHTFPVCKITDGFYGIVKVDYPVRKQYIPVIPCSKHPPLQEIFKTIADDAKLSPNIPLNSQIVKQLQSSCDNQQANILVKKCDSISEPLSVLKTVHNVERNPSKTSKLIKSKLSSQCSSSSLSKSISQENISVCQKSLKSYFSKKDLLNKVLFPSVCNLESTSVNSSLQCVSEQTDSNSELCIISNTSDSLVQNVDTSQSVSSSFYGQSLLNIKKLNFNSSKSTKRKHDEEIKMHIIPNKRKSMAKDLNSYAVFQSSYQNPIHKLYRKRKRSYSPSFTRSDKSLNNKIHMKDNLDLSLENVMVPLVSSTETKLAESPFMQKPQQLLQDKKKQCISETLESNMNNENNLLISNFSILNAINNASLDFEKTCLDTTNSNPKPPRPAKSIYNCTISSQEIEFKSSLSLNCNSNEVFLNSEIYHGKKKAIKHKTKNMCKPYTKLSKKSRNFMKLKRKSNVRYETVETLFDYKNNTRVKASNLMCNDVSQTISQPYKYFRNCDDSCSDILLKSKIHQNYKSKCIESKRSQTIVKESCELESKVNHVYSNEQQLDYHNVSNNSSQNCLYSKDICATAKPAINSIKSVFENKQVSKYDENYCEMGSSTSVLKRNCCEPVKDLGYELNSNKNSSDWICINPKISSSIKSQYLNSFCTVLPQKATPYLDCFPRHKLKFARRRKLLGNFEESILKGCFSPVCNVKGFRVEIGASGSFCPNHLVLPADVSFYELDNLHSSITPYMAEIFLSDIEYCLPKKGAVQVTLFNPSETVVKMFVLNYDLSDMPPMCHTFIRQKTYYMPIGSTEECPSSQKWLRFIIHLRFASSKSGKIYLHKDIKIVVLNKSNDDAASEFTQEPRELRSFLHVPMNPKFSDI